MNLFVGTPFWTTTLENIKEYKSLDGDKICEVLVIGGGMSGMLSAFKVSKDHDTTIIDMERIGFGSSSLNTGLIQYMSDDMLIDLKENFGEKIANDFYLDSVKALDNIESIVKKLDKDPDFMRNNSIILASNEEDFKLLKEEKIKEEKIGISTDLLSKEETESINLKSYGGLITKNDIELNPFKFVRFMSDYACENQNLKIYENTKCLSIDIDNKIVKTNKGNIRYNKLIISTGYNFLKEVKNYIPNAKLIKTFAMITDKMEKGTTNKLDYMVWETASPYFYYRKSKDYNIVIGGNDKEELELSNSELNEEVKKLKDKFYDVRGIRLETIPYSYSAIFGESVSGLPYIGPHPLSKDIYVIHGVGGNGTVYSSIASMYVEDFINESDNLKKIEYLFPEK